MDEVVGNTVNVTEAEQLSKARVETARSILSDQAIVETPTQATAVRLYEMGFNVFPLIYGEKYPCFSWSRLQFTRLHPTHPQYGVQASFRGRCNIAVLCGKTSRNLFILDYDEKDAYEQSIFRCQKMGIPLFTSVGSRGGHIWLLAEEGEVMGGKLDTGEVFGKYKGENTNQFALTPPSVRREDGIVYQWDVVEAAEPPTISITDVDWLTDRRGERFELKVDESTRTHKVYSYPMNPLSRATQDYLNSLGAIERGTRHTRLFNAACDLAGNTYSFEDAHELLAPIAEESGLQDKEIFRTIDDAFSRERTPARETPFFVPIWQKALAYADSCRWSGRTGMTDLSLMHALIQRAKVGCNSEGTFRASYRELSELARCTTKTVQKSLQRIKSANPPLICFAGIDRVSAATLWRFSDYVLQQGLSQLKEDYNCHIDNSHFGETTTLAYFELSSSVLLTQRNTDALERGALGKQGWIIYKTLISSYEPLTAHDLEKQTGLSLWQIYRTLSKDGWLRKAGLVVKQGKGWIAFPATDEQLDNLIARPAGTLGKQDKRRQANSEERSLYLGRIILMERWAKDKVNMFPRGIA